VPSGVDVKIDGTTVSVKGKVGQLTRTLPATMKIDLTDGVITVSRPNDQPDQRALHGLTRSLLNNMVAITLWLQMDRRSSTSAVRAKKT